MTARSDRIALMLLNYERLAVELVIPPVVTFLAPLASIVLAFFFTAFFFFSKLARLMFTPNSVHATPSIMIEPPGVMSLPSSGHENMGWLDLVWFGTA